MESTGKYWHLVFNVLEHDCDVIIANPKYVKGIRGKKTDKKANKMRVCLDHVDSIEKHIADIESVVLNLAQPYLPQVELILSLPGIKDIFTAIAIIGEIGVDMSAFLFQKHICSWAGLTPQNNESAGKKKSVRVSRAGVYIKLLLVQCANAVIRSKDCLYFRYHQIKKSRGHKKAIIAIAHKLLICIYHMLDKNEPFDAELYNIDSNPKPKNTYAPQITEDMAIRYLETLGYQIPDKHVKI